MHIGQNKKKNKKTTEYKPQQNASTYSYLFFYYLKHTFAKCLIYSTLKVVIKTHRILCKDDICFHNVLQKKYQSVSAMFLHVDY